MKRTTLGTLCALALGMLLSAFSCLPQHRVVFDKNNHDPDSTEANPNAQILPPYSTALLTLPAEPTRVGYQFVGWNTKADGSGSPFGLNTPVAADLTVYAQWEPAQPTPPSSPSSSFNVGILPNTTALSPLEPSLSFSVTVTGLANNSDAGKVELNISSALPTKLESSLEGNTKRFLVTVYYDDATTLSEGFVSIRLSLANMEGSPGGTQVVRIAVMDGLEKNRPIPVKQANLEAFSSYANTAEGLTKHYRLIENIALPSQKRWTPIGTSAAPFEGSFDGNNNLLFGLRLSPQYLYPDVDDEQGLFGVISEGVVIENLALLDVNIVNAVVAGGVVGISNGGIVQNCRVTGNFEPYSIAGGVVGINNSGTVQNCHMAGKLVGPGGPTGGVVAVNNGGTVTSCFATGSVTTSNQHAGGVVAENRGGVVQNSYATNNVVSYYVAGGLVGYNDGTVRNGYATGSINGNYSGSSHYISGGVVGINGYPGTTVGTVENCYATGSVHAGYGGVGGVVGNGGIIRNCVALNPSVSMYNRHSIGRVTTEHPVVASMNYARENMALYQEGVLLDMATLVVGPSSMHGQSIAAIGNNSASDLQWWLTAQWSTVSGTKAWDFDNVWDWGPNNLPILRNVGGEQAPGPLWW
jgi:uncharacterized repeat protein (TIGR02543 family)